MNPCVHHWLLTSPQAVQAITGRCRRCGAEREFWPMFLTGNAAYSAQQVALSQVPKDPAAPLVRERFRRAGRDIYG